MRYLIPIFKADLNRPTLEALSPELVSRLKEAPMENTLDPVLSRGAMISPEIASVLHPLACQKIAFVGSTILEQDETSMNMKEFGGSKVCHSIKTFVESGSKPIYVGWGSMLCKSPEYMVELCARAIYHSKQRAIVLGGMADLSQETLEGACGDAAIIEYAQTNILFVPSAPHEWLFPQVSATVHHGGVGTTTAALRAGKPTIITPLITDQYDYAYAVNKLGVGIGMAQMHKVSAAELGDAIVKVVGDKEMAEKALALAVKMRRENGAETAVDEIEAYWKDVGATGKFRELWPGETKPSLWTKLTKWFRLE